MLNISLNIKRKVIWTLSKKLRISPVSSFKRTKKSRDRGISVSVWWLSVSMKLAGIQGDIYKQFEGVAGFQKPFCTNLSTGHNCLDSDNGQSSSIEKFDKIKTVSERYIKIFKAKQLVILNETREISMDKTYSAC